MTSAHISYKCVRPLSDLYQALHPLGLLAITALSLLALFFYCESPAAVKLVHDRTTLEGGEFLHALPVESRHAFRISFALSPAG